MFLSSVYVTAVRSMEAIMFSRWLAFCFIFLFLLFFCCYFSYAGNQFPLFVRMCIRVNVQFCGLGKIFLFVAATFFYCHFCYFWCISSLCLMMNVIWPLCSSLFVHFFVFLMYDEHYTFLLTWHSKWRRNWKRWESSFHRLTWSLNRKNTVRRSFSSKHTHTHRKFVLPYNSVQQLLFRMDLCISVTDCIGAKLEHLNTGYFS